MCLSLNSLHCFRVLPIKYLTPGSTKDGFKLSICITFILTKKIIHIIYNE